MNDFKINDYLIREKAKEIAADALLEATEYGSDPHDLMHEICDGHEWVIYTYKAIKLCAECDTSDGEQYLEDLGIDQFDSFADHATKLAFATLLGACHSAYAELN
jgi:hypothetical protein